MSIFEKVLRQATQDVDTKKPETAAVGKGTLTETLGEGLVSDYAAPGTIGKTLADLAPSFGVNGVREAAERVAPHPMWNGVPWAARTSPVEDKVDAAIETVDGALAKPKAWLGMLGAKLGNTKGGDKSTSTALKSAANGDESKQPTTPETKQPAAPLDGALAPRQDATRPRDVTARMPRFARGSVAKLADVVLDIGLGEDEPELALPEWSVTSESSRLDVSLRGVRLAQKVAVPAPPVLKAKPAVIDAKASQTSVVANSQQQTKVARTTSDAGTDALRRGATQSMSAILDVDAKKTAQLTQQAMQKPQLRYAKKEDGLEEQLEALSLEPSNALPEERTQTKSQPMPMKQPMQTKQPVETRQPAQVTQPMKMKQATQVQPTQARRAEHPTQPTQAQPAHPNQLSSRQANPQPARTVKPQLSPLPVKPAQKPGRAKAQPELSKTVGNDRPSIPQWQVQETLKTVEPLPSLKTPRQELKTPLTSYRNKAASKPMLGLDDELMSPTLTHERQHDQQQLKNLEQQADHKPDAQTRSDLKDKTRQLGANNQQRTDKATNRQNKRNQAATTRGAAAQQQAAKRAKEYEARTKKSAEAQKASMLAQIESHATEATAVLDMNRQQLETYYNQKLELNLTEIGNNLKTTKAQVQKTWGAQKPHVIEAHRQATADIVSTCKQERIIAKNNIVELQRLLKNDPPKAAQAALDQGNKDAKRFQDTCDKNVKRIGDDADKQATFQEKLGAEAYRVGMAKAARCEDSNEKASLEKAAEGSKAAFDKKATDARTKGKTDSDNEIIKYSNLIAQRLTTATKTALDILANGKDYASKLDDQLKTMLEQIDALEKDGTRLADERKDYDIKRIDNEITEEFIRLDAEVVDATQKARDAIKFSLASARELTADEKAAKKIEIQKAKESATAIIQKTEAADLQLVQFELDDAHARISDALNGMGTYTAQAVKQLSTMKHDFDRQALTVASKFDGMGQGAEAAQVKLAKAVKNDATSIRNGYADAGKNPNARRELDENAEEFKKQVDDDRKADAARAQRMAGLRDPQKDAQRSDTKVRGAANQIINKHIGNGVNEDVSGVMKELSDLSPEEVKAVLENPEVKQALAANLVPADLARLTQMANAETPDQVKAYVLAYAFKGGSGFGYDDKLFKETVRGMSPEQRKEVDRYFQMNKTDTDGKSIEDTINSEAYFSSQNNRMMQAYWKSDGAAIGEETAQAARGGWLTELSDFKKNHPWLYYAGAAALTVTTGGAAAPLLFGPGVDMALDQVKGYGANTDVLVAQRDRLREMTAPPPNATPEQIAESQEKFHKMMGEIEKQLGTHHNTTLEQLDNEEASSSYNRSWMKEGDNTTFKSMLDASRTGDWDTYGKNKSAFGAETSLGNRNYLQQETDYLRKRGELDKIKDLTGFLAKRSKGGTYESYLNENISQEVDRKYFKMLGDAKEVQRGSEEWKQQQALRLIYAQFGGRTGWGDDRPSIESIIAEAPDAETAKFYAEYAKQLGLTEAPETKIMEWLGPLKYFTGQYWLGNWSTGDLDQDLKLSYGAQISDWTGGFIGKGRGYTQIEYDRANGRADTIEKQIARAKHMRDFDTKSGWLGSAGMGASGRIADAEYKRLLESYERMKALGLHDVSLDDPNVMERLTGDQLYELSQFTVQQKLTEQAAIGANETQRGLVDGVITVVTTACTIIAAVGISIITAGTATPFIVAALATAGATLLIGMAALGAKAVVLGGKYSGNEAKIDFASTIIDAVVAGVTAGKGIDTFAKHALGKLGIDKVIARELLKELLSNGIQAGADLTKFLMNEDLYRGTPQDFIDKMKARTAQLAARTVAGTALGTAGVNNALVTNAVQSVIEYDPSQPFMGQFLNYVNAVATQAGSNAGTKVGTRISEKRWGEQGMWGGGKVTTREDGTVEVSSPRAATELERASQKGDGVVDKITTSDSGATTYRVKTETGTVDVTTPATQKTPTQKSTTDKPSTDKTSTDKPRKGPGADYREVGGAIEKIEGDKIVREEVEAAPKKTLLDEVIEAEQNKTLLDKVLEQPRKTQIVDETAPTRAAEATIDAPLVDAPVTEKTPAMASLVQIAPLWKHAGDGLTIEMVEKIWSRFETMGADTYDPNVFQIDRLRRIAAGEIRGNETDRKYFLHEKREWEKVMLENVDQSRAHLEVIEEQGFGEHPYELYASDSGIMVDKKRYPKRDENGTKIEETAAEKRTPRTIEEAVERAKEPLWKPRMTPDYTNPDYDAYGSGIGDGFRYRDKDESPANWSKEQTAQQKLDATLKDVKLGDVAKAMLDGAKTSQERQSLAENMAAVYELVKSTTPETAAKNPEAVKQLIQYHLAMGDEMQKLGESVRKVIPRKAFEEMLRGVDYRGLATELTSVIGFVGDVRNTKTLGAREIIEMLGLDYDGSPYIRQNNDKEYRGIDQLFVLDTKIDRSNHGVVRENLKIAMHPALIEAIQVLAAEGDRDAQRIVGQLVEHRSVSATDPYTGFGMTTSGPRLSQDKENLVLSQERKVTASDDVNSLQTTAGSRLLVKTRSGAEIEIATYVTSLDGSQGHWQISKDLPAALRKRYETIAMRGELDSSATIEGRKGVGILTEQQSREARERLDVGAKLPKDSPPTTLEPTSSPTVSKKE